MPELSHQTTVTPAPAPAQDTGSIGSGGPVRGNEDQQAKVKARVAGPIGRVWNHVLGKPEGATDTDGAVADRAMVRAYLDQRLKLADGEWFRGAKLDGVTDKLMETLDTDKDGRIGWTEFKAYETEIFKQLAPGADPKSSPESVKSASDRAFTGADRKKDGKLSRQDLADDAKGRLPKDTEHADLIGDLAGRVTIDAVDRNEAGKPVGERSVDRGEWNAAAEEIAAGRR